MKSKVNISVLYSFVLVLSFHDISFSQDHKTSIEIIGGIGNYEYLNAGLKLPMFHIAYMEGAIGFKPWHISSETYGMAYLLLGIHVLKEKDNPRFIEPSLQWKIFTWYFNNEFNRFVMLGTGPELRLTHDLNSRFRLSANGGIVYNTPLHYERKTYQEVGWPKDWQPSFSLQLSYRLHKTI